MKRQAKPRARNKPTAFIVHGQDVRLRLELEKFLRGVGFEILLFHAATSGEDQIDAVLRNVVNGVNRADVVIVLFTPEEQASFHDPETGQYVPKTKTGEDMGGWQPRPNVIFEAGVAVVRARRKTILAKIGSVRIISDLAGVAFVELDADNAKTVLLDRLRDRVKTLSTGLSPETLPGDFGIYRNRWPYHDEVGELEAALAEIIVPGSRKTLIEALVTFVESRPKANMWSSAKIIKFISTGICRDKKDDGSTNWAFWQLLVAGFFAFDDIDEAGDGWSDDARQLWWDDLQDYVSLTARGLALLHKLSVLHPKP